MKQRKSLSAIVGLFACILLGACASAQPTAAPIPTPLPATATPVPVIPATDTPAATPVVTAEHDTDYWLAHQKPVGVLGFSPDGHTLVVSASASIYLFDMQAAAPTARISFALGDSPYPYPQTLDPETSRLAAGNGVWELATGRQLYQLPLENVSGSVFSPDGATLAIGAGNDITLWEAATGKFQKSIGVGLGDVRALAFSADGKALYAVSGDNKVLRSDLPGGLFKELFPLPKGGCCAVFSPHANYMLVNLPDHGVGSKELWDVEKGARLKTMMFCDNDTALQAFSLDSRFFAIGPCFDQGNSIVRAWDIHTDQKLPEVKHPPLANFPVEWRSAVFSPDGTKIVTGDDLGQIMIWDLATNELLQTLSLQ